MVVKDQISGGGKGGIVLLEGVGENGNTTASYTYDEIGNITPRNGMAYTYHPEHLHAVEWVGSDNYTYDANGNIRVRGWSTVNQTLEWDAENRLVSVSCNGTVIAEFVYDGDGNRIAKKEAGETVFYINGYYEQNMTTGNATSNYYLGGKLIATSENGTIRYIHTDHLGSTVMMTDTLGNVTGNMTYEPYGETSSGDVDTDIKFTGQRLDDTGLYFYNARYYDATIGRFISPDTIIPNPANPQSFNRYSYCLNNPLKYVDPSGHLTGTVTINGETYTVVDDGGGNHHLVASDGSTTASLPLSELIQMISDKMGLRGDYSYGGNDQYGVVVGINVQTGYWQNPSYLVSYVPEGIWSPASALGRLGVSIGPIGVYVRHQLMSSEEIEKNTLHELDHRVWQGRMGFVPWYFAYYEEIGMKWAYYGGDYNAGPYNASYWERSARRMAGQSISPNPTPWWQPGWNNFTQAVTDLTTDVADSVSDFFSSLWPW